jgi:hypothetical protein
MNSCHGVHPNRRIRTGERGYPVSIYPDGREVHATFKSKAGREEAERRKMIEIREHRQKASLRPLSVSAERRARCRVGSQRTRAGRMPERRSHGQHPSGAPALQSREGQQAAMKRIGAKAKKPPQNIRPEYLGFSAAKAGVRGERSKHRALGSAPSEDAQRTHWRNQWLSKSEDLCR